MLEELCQGYHSVELLKKAKAEMRATIHTMRDGVSYNFKALLAYQRKYDSKRLEEARESCRDYKWR